MKPRYHTLTTRWVRIVETSLVLSIWLLAATTGSALAHANLVRSAPAASAILDSSPGELRLWFAEAPEPRFSEIQLFDRTSQPVGGIGPVHADPSNPSLLVASLPPLPPGVHTVAWRATSAVDGHVIAGALALAVGRDQVPAAGLRPTLPGAPAGSAATPTLPGIGIRWLGYLASALLTGAFAFFLLVLRPTLDAAALMGDGGGRPSAERVAAVFDTVPRALLAMGAAGWAMAVGVTLVRAVLQAAADVGVEPLDALGTPLLALLSGTRYGTLFWLRMLVLGLLAGVLVFGRWQFRRASTLAHWWWWIGLGLSALLLLATSLGSHAAAGPSPIAETIADWLHLAAMSVWVGGLMALLLTLLYLRRTEGSLPPGVTGQLVGRFSQVAIVCVVLLGVTGVYRAVSDVAGWDNLLDTAYGTTLLIKLALLVPLLGLAGVDLLLVTRRMAAPTSAPEPSAATGLWSRRLRLVAGGEVLLVSAVLLVTSLLTSLPPGREAFGAGLVVRANATDLRAVLVASPGEAGLNTFDVYVRDGSGKPVIEAEKVALIFTMVEHDMGENEAVADNVGGGHYLAQGGYLAMAGTWHARLLVRRPGLDDARTTLTLRLSIPAGQPPATSAPAPGLATELIPGIGFLLGGLLLAFLGWQLGSVRPWAGLVFFSAGVAIAAFSAVTVVGALMAPSSAAVKNPVPADAASLDRGKQLYEANCTSCHGISGRGDGPAGLTLRPRPADFRLHMAAGHTDGQLFDWITNGVPKTAMLPFGGRLSEQERWNVINYIRTFAAPTPGAAPPARAVAAASATPAATATAATAQAGSVAPTVTSRPAITPTSSTPVSNGPPLLTSEMAATGWAIAVWADQIWVSDDSGAFHPIVDLPQWRGFVSTPAWQPDGQHIAYALDSPSRTPATDRTGAAPTVTSDIWQVDRNGTAQMLVEHDGDDVRLGQPAWQPDGSAIFYSRTASVRNGDLVTGESTRIEQRTLASGERKVLAANGQQPAVSPDGKMLAYVQVTDIGQPALWVLDLASGKRRRLTSSRFLGVTSPRFSPDGRKIAFGAGVAPPSGKTPGNPLDWLLGLFNRMMGWLVPAASAHGIPYGLWLADVAASGLQQVGNLAFDYPVVRWTAGGRYLFVYDENGSVDQVDIERGLQTAIYHPGVLSGFDWLPKMVSAAGGDRPRQEQ